MVHQVGQLYFPHILAPYQHPSGLYIPEPGQEICHCGFSATGGTNLLSHGMLRQSKGDILEHLFFPIGKAHMLKFHLRRGAFFRNRGFPVVRQFFLRKDFLNPVHAAVHNGKPCGLAIESLNGAEQVGNKQHDAY